MRYLPVFLFLISCFERQDDYTLKPLASVGKVLTTKRARSQDIRSFWEFKKHARESANLAQAYAEEKCPSAQPAWEKARLAWAKLVLMANRIDSQVVEFRRSPVWDEKLEEEAERRWKTAKERTKSLCPSG